MMPLAEGRMRPCRAGGCVCSYPFLQWAPQPAGAHLQMCVGPFRLLSPRRIGLCPHAVEAILRPTETVRLCVQVPLWPAANLTGGFAVFWF